GDRRQETGDRRQETGDRRQETGDRRQETGDRRQETKSGLIQGKSGCFYKPLTANGLGGLDPRGGKQRSLLKKNPEISLSGCRIAT
ncbi:MAG TPA: hypothetical protein VMP01_02575, partial [Pirellulaceae bacterium]|nr:hypothetical protein [Pirellulaceae bacterium]